MCTVIDILTSSSQFTSAPLSIASITLCLLPLRAALNNSTS